MRSWPVALLLLSALAGCADVAPTTDAATEPEAPSWGPQAVVALIDTGINPYHVDFRDNSSLAFVHPSMYLPGYDADTPALNLTLNATSLEAALDADAEVWAEVEAGQNYWIPGTKIVGAISFNGGIVFDTGHGTMTASRAAGNAYSLCPECRIAAVQGFNAQAVTWASQQPWIDAQSNSWSPLVVFQQADIAQESGLADAFEEAATRHLVFGSAGNGVAGKGGAIGHPSFTRSTSGPTGVISVGGHDNGELILWSGSVPHVVADACDNWAAVGDTIDEYSPSEGGGTSSASPYAAGAAARFILEARILASDTYQGIHDGILVHGEPRDAAMLDDGMLTLDEVQRLLMVTATPRPVETEHDGTSCGMTGAPYNTYPLAWSDVPAGTPDYYLIGYGQISVDSLALGLDVLHGGDVPDRSESDTWHARFQQVRDAYNDLPR